MTIIEARLEPNPVFTRSQRHVAAILLIVGPTLMLLSSVGSGLASSSTSGGEEWAAAIDAPAWTSASWIVGFLSVPAMICWGLVVLLIARPWSPKAAWVGAVMLIVQVCALAAVMGMELVRNVLAQEGTDPVAVQTILDSAVPATPAGIVLMLAFLPTLVIALICFGFALWRTGWVPRWIAILFMAFPFIDFFTSEIAWASAGAFLALLTSSAVLAMRVFSDGAPRPARREETG
jgi:hypothetical protein